MREMIVNHVIEKELYISEDKPYKPVESQKVTIESEQALISRLNLETSRGTAKEKLRILVKPRDIKKTDDIYRNPKDYNVLLQLVSLWYIRLRHLSLNLLKKTVKITNGMPNLDVIKKKDFVYLVYDRSKAVRKPNLKAFSNLLKILNTLEKDIFKIKPKSYNKRFIKLFIIDCKSQFK